ncbi:putative allantoate permease [Fusarium solani]|uniref:Allantoate permease n=1 Tax=Fusarium solani TaxID=169388 RepID=A0A9P9GNZ4_FUSSL|nr:putative allantoate permease [Fusarium solani]KAH7242860.1 putative allantoate permease [Fusarium solani]
MAEKEQITSPSNVTVGSGDVRDVKQVPRGRDIAAELTEQFADEPGFDREEETRLRWKIGMRLTLILFLNITLPAMDKVTPSTGALYGMRQDLHLKGNQYSWIGSSFYFGYLIWCFPSSQILQRLPIAKSISGAMLAWGFALIGAGFSKSFAPMVITRILPGALEAPVAPGNFLIMTMWYTREEQPGRAGLFYTGLATLITGTLGWAVGFIHSEWAWRSFFWITLGITLIYAVIVGIFLPDNPVKAKFISQREKYVAVEHMGADKLGIENKTSTLLMMPTGVIQTLSSYVCNLGVYICIRRFPNLQLRGAFVISGLVVGLIATVFLYTLPNDAYVNRLLALYWSYVYLGPYIVSLGLNSANAAGHTKKITMNTVVFAFFKANQAPLYSPWYGCHADLIDDRADQRVHMDADFNDVTDQENVHFRYVW